MCNCVHGVIRNVDHRSGKKESPTNESALKNFSSYKCKNVLLNWSTRISGTGNERGTSVYVNNMGEVVVVGTFLAFHRAQITIKFNRKSLKELNFWKILIDAISLI